VGPPALIATSRINSYCMSHVRCRVVGRKKLDSASKPRGHHSLYEIASLPIVFSDIEAPTGKRKQLSYIRRIRGWEALVARKLASKAGRDQASADQDPATHVVYISTQ
jgi:hypothetical protein